MKCTILNSFLSGILLLIASSFAIAETQGTNTTSDDKNIDLLAKRLSPVFNVTEIIPMGDTGLYRIRLDDNTSLFTTIEAKGFLIGDLYTFQEGRFVNKSEELLNQERYTAVTRLPVEELVVFPAEGEKIGDMYVFTDVDCGYCRRLHQEINILQKSGVEVRYIAWPRCGTEANCPSYHKLVNVWCSNNQQQAMTDAKNGKYVESDECSTPIKEQFELGRKLGLRGTPFIMLSNGKGIPGYQPAGEIVQLF